MIHRLFFIHSTIFRNIYAPRFQIEVGFFPHRAPCDLSELLFDLETQSD